MKDAVEWYAWAAGIIDGEGCILLSPGKHDRCKEYWTLRVSVSQVDRRLLTRLHAMFGGSVSSHGRMQAKGGRPISCWRVTSRQAEHVLRTVFPWLVVKREQAELALQSRDYMGTRGIKGSANLPILRDLHRRLKLLKWAPESVGQNAPLESQVSI